MSEFGPKLQPSLDEQKQKIESPVAEWERSEWAETEPYTPNEEGRMRAARENMLGRGGLHIFIRYFDTGEPLSPRYQFILDTYFKDWTGEDFRLASSLSDAHRDQWSREDREHTEQKDQDIRWNERINRDRAFYEGPEFAKLVENGTRDLLFTWDSEQTDIWVKKEDGSWQKGKIKTPYTNYTTKFEMVVDGEIILAEAKDLVRWQAEAPKE